MSFIYLKLVLRSTVNSVIKAMFGLIRFLSRRIKYVKKLMIDRCWKIEKLTPLTLLNAQIVYKLVITFPTVFILLHVNKRQILLFSPFENLKQ